MDISVILATYNRENYLKKALESLFLQETDEKFSFEIIVIDDLSEDGTEKMVKELAKDNEVPLNLIKGNGIGQPYAINEGVKAAKGDWLALFDDDEIAEKNYLYEMFLVAIQNHADGISGNRSLLFEGDDIPDLHPGLRDYLGERLFGKEVKKCDSGFLPWGGVSMVRKKIFEDLGGYDTSFFYGGDDTEFFFRMQKEGYELWHTPRAVVHHIVPNYRVKASYFEWKAKRDGKRWAMFQLKHKGHFRILIAIPISIVRLLTKEIWGLLLNFFGSYSEKIWAKCLIIRRVNYLLACLHYASGGLLPSKAFLEASSFRARGGLE